MRDFRGADLRGLDFADDDLADYDFSGADLTGADLSRARCLDRLVTDGLTRLPAGFPLRPPADFDIAKARATILAGEAPPPAWRPFITELSFVGQRLADLAPLAGLAGLRTLRLDGTAVADLAPLAGLAGLQWLTLNGTRVADLAPLAGLSQLRMLDLRRTRGRLRNMMSLPARLVRQGRSRLFQTPRQQLD